eukprot:460638-Prymnesium_polylepis.1
MEAMRTHLKVAAVQVQACGALRNMCTQRPVIAQIIKAGGVEAAVGAVAQHIYDEATMEQGLACLTNLCAVPTTSPQNSKPVSKGARLSRAAAHSRHTCRDGPPARGGAHSPFGVCSVCGHTAEPAALAYSQRRWPPPRRPPPSWWRPRGTVGPARR